MSGSSFLSYILVFISAALLGLNLWKDWQAHGGSIRRYGYAFLIIVYVIISVGNLYLTEKRNEAEKSAAIDDRNRVNQESSDSRTEIVRLRQVIQTEQSSHERANSQCLASLTRLYAELSNLKTAARTSELRQHIVNLQEQLKVTEETVATANRAPKAKLDVGFLEAASDTLSNETAVKRNPDGSINVKLWVVNHSQAAAITGEIVFRICDECKFLKEPEGLQRATGSIEQDRNFPLVVLAPSSQLLFAFSILPPRGLPFRFTIGMRYVCQTCVNDSEWHDVTVSFPP
jgi:hypothetical protein